MLLFDFCLKFTSLTVIVNSYDMGSFSSHPSGTEVLKKNQEYISEMNKNKVGRKFLIAKKITFKISSQISDGTLDPDALPD